MELWSRYLLQNWRYRGESDQRTQSNTKRLQGTMKQQVVNSVSECNDGQFQIVL